MPRPIVKTSDGTVAVRWTAIAETEDGQEWLRVIDNDHGYDYQEIMNGWTHVVPPNGDTPYYTHTSNRRYFDART